MAALPSMALLSQREIGSADMTELTSMALGDAGRVGGAAWLYAVLTDSSRGQAELLMLRLPDVQPVQSTRFAVPSPVASAHFDSFSGYLYMLCVSAQPTLLRMHVDGGLSPSRVGKMEVLTLPWAKASGVLLPFPEQRQLLMLAAPGPSEEGRPMRFCRVRLGTPLQEVRLFQLCCVA